MPSHQTLSLFFLRIQMWHLTVLGARMSPEGGWTKKEKREKKNIICSNISRSMTIWFAIKKLTGVFWLDVRISTRALTRKIGGAGRQVCAGRAVQHFETPAIIRQASPIPKTTLFRRLAPVLRRSEIKFFVKEFLGNPMLLGAMLGHRGT